LHPFRYVAATTVTEVVSVLSEHGPRARCLAGGTDILTQTRTGRYELDALVDIKSVPEAVQLRLDGDGLHLGAATPCCLLYENEQISAAYPGIMDAASMIGGVQIQSRASLGGNLCNASPSADGIPPLVVHIATAIIAGPNGARQVPVEEFCTGPSRTVLERGEFLLALHIPKPPAHFGAAYQRFIPRNEMDIAVAGVGCSVVLEPGGERIQSARIALAAVGPTPILAREAGDSLAGKAATPEAIRAAAELAAKAASPITDMRGTVQQRRHLVRVLTGRTLEKAVQRAQESF
jgi:CO/xanthine dehydrogenase FAD-binding subunit